MWDSTRWHIATPDGHVGWMGCAPPLLTLVPETPTPVGMTGPSAPALSRADGGKPIPVPWPFLGCPTSCRLHCVPGGVKGPWVPDPQLRLAVP